ncbi:MAG: glycoside hydrolase family 32 protein [Bryobacteraceae bacterium]
MRRRTFLSLPSAAFAAEPRKQAADYQRPKYHFLPASNWMNDPNAPIFWKGQYHMFYQYNPNGAFWGTMHWGHATSADMIRWKHLPVALAPTPGGSDKDGVFSGCAVDNNGVPTLIYTGTKPETQCIATSTDGLITWKKDPRNPVIPGPPAGLAVTGFRDPCVWRENDAWYMALGSGFAGVGGAVLLYTSPDLIHWTYMHPLFSGSMDAKSTSKNPVATGEMWECPSFFPLGDKHVLFVSTQGGTPYYIGKYKDFRFEAEVQGHLDHGAYYAPITQLDAQGRRILWGWIPERRSSHAQRIAGWSGVLSLPRVLSIRPDGLLGIDPAAPVRTLRQGRQNFVNIAIPDGKPARLTEVTGDCLEIHAEIDPGDADEYGLQLCCSADLVDTTPIVHNRTLNRLSGAQPHASQNGNLLLTDGETLRLTVFVDCSVIEVFANGRTCLTERAYTNKAGNTGVALFARGGYAKLKSMQVYEMKPISGDRMTT